MARPKRLHLLTGRPSRYRPRSAWEICDRLADGENLAKICRDEHMPDERTVRRWVLDNVDPDFTVAYNQARRIQAGRWADEIIDLSDESRRAAGDMALMQSYKLSVDSRKWLAARLLPDAYGDRVLVDRQPRSEIHIFLPQKDVISPSELIEDATAKLVDSDD